MIETWNQRYSVRINNVHNWNQFGSPQTLISAKKKIIPVKLAISYYGTPLLLLWNTFVPAMGRNFDPSMEQVSVPTMGQMYIIGVP